MIEKRLGRGDTSTLVPVLLTCLGVLLSGCFGDGDRDEAWERFRGVIGPLAVKDRVVYVDAARDRVISLESRDGSVVTHRESIGRNAIFAMPAPDRQHVAVITRGEEALRAGQVDEGPKFWLVPVGSEGTEVRSYPIGSPFDRLALSSDGGVAIAYFSKGGFDESSGVFRNPNEIAVVDLREPASESNPVLRTLRSFGSAPEGIVLSPPMTIPGTENSESRVLAFVLAPDTVTILDTSNPKSREVSIRLGSAIDSGEVAEEEKVNPRELAFAPNTGTAYLRSDNADDVLAIHLLGEEAENELDNDFQVLLAELGAGSGPSDVAVYDDALGRRQVLAAMPGRNQLAIIDGDTAEFKIISTPDPIDRVMLFPSNSDIPPRYALLASLSLGLPRLHYLALDNVSDTLVPLNLSTVNLAEPVLDVIEIPGSQRAMIVHDANRTVLGLLDFAIGAVSPLEGVGRLDSFDFTGDGQTLVGVTQGAKRVGFLDLDSLHPTNIRIDDMPTTVLTLSDGTIVVDHGDPFGRATILPSIASERRDAVVVSGFLLDGYLNDDYE